MFVVCYRYFSNLELKENVVKDTAVGNLREEKMSSKILKRKEQVTALMAQYIKASGTLNHLRMSHFR